MDGPPRTDNPGVSRRPTKPITPEVQAAHLARLAWWSAFVLTVSFIAALWLVRSADAAPLPTSAASAALSRPGTGAGIEFELEAEEEDEEAQQPQQQEEAGVICEPLAPSGPERVEEEEECESEEAVGVIAPVCRIASAEATVAAIPGRDQVRLALRYKAFQASVVAVELKLRGAKGTLDLGAETERFRRAGVLHQSSVLTDAQMERVQAAREFTVGIQAVNTPKSCHGLFDRHLTVRHSAGSALTWSDPTADSRR